MKLILTIGAVAVALSASAQKSFELASPDGTLKAEISVSGGEISYSVLKNGSLVLSFLGEGDWKMELFKDGLNATRHAEDYRRFYCHCEEGKSPTWQSPIIKNI